MTEPSAIRIRGLTKSFPGVAALRGVDLDIYQSEVHGLVGENGAGKSTLIKHLTGLYAADSGSIQLFGRALENARARALQQAGIGVIYQERAILPELTAAANVFLGRQKTWGPFLDRGATVRRFRELADRLGVALDPDARAGSLSVAGQQLLEIMRALEAEHRILIMDGQPRRWGRRSARSCMASSAACGATGFALFSSRMIWTMCSGSATACR